MYINVQCLSAIKTSHMKTYYGSRSIVIMCYTTVSYGYVQYA